VCTLRMIMLQVMRTPAVVMAQVQLVNLIEL
jgi:hypothetical protein